MVKFYVDEVNSNHINVAKGCRKNQHQSTQSYFDKQSGKTKSDN